ncbi:MFS transporter [Wenzhouxiangella limi]|uniref:MFS transporter n=1 Tax=Wenzhouxiangella limi TaxID=2707351 RepID=A0A845VAZ6_9GAMM|nr:MFS transporter [Wenzhouxiangella limi]
MTSSNPAAGLPAAGRFALAAALVSSFGQTFFIGLFGADFRAEFGLGEAGLGLLYGAATLVSGLLMFWLGAIADHWRLARAAILSTGLLAGGALGIALAEELWHLAVGLFLVRLGGQGLTGHLAVVAAARYARRRRGRAVAMASYGFILGEAVFPLLVASVLGVLAWHQVWLLAALLVVAITMPGLYLLAARLQSPVAEDHDSDSGSGKILARRELFIHGGFLRVLGVVLVPPVLVTAVFLHQGTLGEIQGWRLAEVARGFVLFAAMQGLLAFVGGRLIDRFSARALLRFALLPAGVAMLGLGLLPSQVALWLLFAGLGMTAGLNGVISGAVWVELFGTAQLGMIRGVYAALMVVSTAVGPVLLGALLAVEVSLLVLGAGFFAYAIVVPALLVPGIRGFAEPGQKGAPGPCR